MNADVDENVGPEIDLNAPVQPVASPASMDDNGFPTSPLRDQEDLWFVQAAGLYAPISKGASTARASGLIMLLSGVLTLVLGALSVNVVTIVIGLIVSTLGWMERSAGNDLAQVKSSAPTRLAVNQLLIFALVAGTCFLGVRNSDVQSAQAMTEAEIAQLPPEAQGLAQQVAELGPAIVYTLFGVIAAASLLFQGTMAVYYLSRRRKVREFDEELPPWVADIVRTIAVR